MVGFLISALALFIFLFIFWKRLKEDYVSEIIFSLAFFGIFGFLTAYGVSRKFFPDWFFWSSFAGLVVGIAIPMIKFKVLVSEVFDALVISFLPVVSLLFLYDSATNSSLSSFLAFLTTLFIIFLFVIFDLNYKNFLWYKSGKIGFSGLTTLGIFFLIRAGIAIFYTSVLSFVGKSEFFISGILAVVCFVLVIFLGNVKN